MSQFKPSVILHLFPEVSERTVLFSYLYIYSDVFCVCVLGFVLGCGAAHLRSICRTWNRLISANNDYFWGPTPTLELCGTLLCFLNVFPFLFIYLYSVSVLRTQNGNTVISPTAESGGVEINIPGKWYRRRRFCCVFVVISQSSNLSASHRGRGGSALSTPWSDWLQEAQPIISLRPDPHWDLAGERPSFNSSLKHVSNMSCSTTWEYYLCSQRWPYLSVPSLLHICLHGCSRLSFG